MASEKLFGLPQQTARQFSQEFSIHYPMSAHGNHPPRSRAAEEALARLFPHRTHESNWFKGLLCVVGLDRWYSPNLADLVPQTWHPVLPLALCVTLPRQ